MTRSVWSRPNGSAFPRRSEKRCVGSVRAARGSRAQGYDELWTDEVKFQLEPPFAMLDLADIRFLMDPALAAQLVFENA